jgi:NAD(P) transhydrogenase subunit beta
VQSSDAVKVITVRGTGFDAAAATGGSAAVETVAAVADSGKSSFVGSELSKSDRPELTAAKIIVSGGRALGSSEKFDEVITPLADKLGAAIGAITFSGSVIAFGKLSGKYKFRLFQGAPVSFKGQHMLNLVLGLATVGLGLVFMFTESWPAFFAMLALAFVMGVLIIIPIGGADMPVVVSMLNSYSGWAAAGIGFTLGNLALIITGSLVGSSGAILSYIMCHAMNRSFISVIAGGFGTDGVASSSSEEEMGEYREMSPEDVAELLKNSSSVIITPGYGMAVAQAQYPVADITQKLRDIRNTMRDIIT